MPSDKEKDAAELEEFRRREHFAEDFESYMEERGIPVGETKDNMISLVSILKWWRRGQSWAVMVAFSIAAAAMYALATLMGFSPPPN